MVISIVENCKGHVAFSARVLVRLRMFFQVLVQIQKGAIAFQTVIASKNCLSSHQFNSMVLTDVGTILDWSIKLRFAKTAQVRGY